MATAESEDFAALLRELKDRSGRSYGVLAGKLHVSTSTLHRYCNGDAVPNEFAPIDRLARLCGATREESVELHRRWILADEARRRSRGAAAEAARPVARTEPEPKAAAPAAATGPAPEPEPATPEPEPAPEPEVVSVVTDVVTGVVTDAPAPRRPSRITKRTRLVLIGAAVVALAVPAVAVAALSGGSGDDGGPKSSAVADAEETGRTLPKGTLPKPPAPSPDASSASPSGSGSPSARTPSAPAPRKHAPPAADPLAVGVSSYQWDGPCGKFYLLDQKPGSVPKPPAPEESRPWAGLLGGVDGGHLTLQLTATGKTAESVVINAVHVRVVDRGAPLDWTAYSMGSGCGGSITPGFFDIDLDASQPRAKPVGGTQGEAKAPATDFPYKVSATDPQVLNLDVHTDAHDVTWYLEIDWSSGDRSGKIPVYDNGKPFHSSAIKGRPAYEYRLDTNVWERLTT